MTGAAPPMTWETGDLLNTLLAGFLLFVGVYHALLYLRRREMKAYLWLAFLCAGALTVNLTSTLVDSGLEGVWIEWLKIGNSLGVAMASASLMEFALALCGRSAGWGTRLLEAVLAITVLGNLWGGAALFNLFLITVIVSILNAARVILGAARTGHREARTVVWGMGALGAALLGEILMYFSLLPEISGLPITGFTLLFLSMAVSLSNRFERAHRELDALRVDLEKRVEERTRALDGANRRLRRYFPARVVERILSSGEDVRPTTERRELTILFADLVDFTAFSDGADPQTVSTLVNEYITAMLEEIEARHGTLDKVMGDGVMAFWGAPAPMAPDEQARQAVDAGVAMQRRLGELSGAWERTGLRRFQARIGIHQDIVAVGDIGTADLWSFTAIGGGVNAASRLEKACPPGRLLVSDGVRARFPASWPFEGPLELRLKGIQGGARAWTLDPAAVEEPRPGSG